MSQSVTQVLQNLKSILSLVHYYIILIDDAFDVIHIVCGSYKKPFLMHMFFYWWLFYIIPSVTKVTIVLMVKIHMFTCDRCHIEPWQFHAHFLRIIFKEFFKVFQVYDYSLFFIDLWWSHFSTLPLVIGWCVA